MSRTKHHKEYQHYGHDYGFRHKCNRGYSQSYGKIGRQLLHKELRQEDKEVIKNELDQEVYKE